MANKNTPESSKSPKPNEKETGIFGGIDEGRIDTPPLTQENEPSSSRNRLPFRDPNVDRQAEEDRFRH